MMGFSARVVSLLALLLASRVMAQVQRFPAFDPERIFMLGDADLDGRLSLDEFRELYRSSPRLTYRYAGRDLRLTDIKGVVHRAILG
jgi:hypothetical protein